jgi:hypothetical protein
MSSTAGGADRGRTAMAEGCRGRPDRLEITIHGRGNVVMPAAAAA